jgi:hypothetical protein
MLKDPYMSAKVFSRLVAFIAALVLFPPEYDMASAQEPKKPPASSAPSDLFRVGDMAQAASDLRKAGEAFERFGNSLDGIAGKVSESLATMSSEFDPFGYKTAFRTIGQQMVVIQQQNEIIRELQEQETKRLRNENKSLKKRLRKRKSR